MPAGTITSLALQQGDRERINVFIDDEFALGVSLYVAQDQGLRKGQVLSEDDWQRLVDAEGGSKAWNAALRLLEARPRSEHELRDRLRRKEYTPGQIDAAIARLRELQLIDDAHFARLWIANRRALNPRGVRALRDELRAKGVEREIVERVVAEQDDPEREHAACLSVARKALRRYDSAPDRATFTRRMGGFLQRRGFGWETVQPILEQLWNERS